MKKIYNRWFNILGYEIEIRILPHEFKADCEKLDKLIKDRNFVDFKLAIQYAYTKWGYDEDLLYIDTLAGFLEGDDDDRLESTSCKD